MRAYINSAGVVSPQNTYDPATFLEEPVNREGGILWCVEPNYRDLIPPKYLRRMSRIVKMGVYAAKVCLNQVKTENLDAIITGTGLGCLEDTEKFLSTIFENEEGLVNPTKFIQSTHNTISSQIALMLNCNNYNFTYVHRGFSFENALLDAMMKFEEREGQNILVGGLDEITENYLTITKRLRQWKHHSNNQLDLLQNHWEGKLLGEGAAFFMLCNQRTDQSMAQIAGLKMFYKPDSQEEINQQITQFISQTGLALEDIDVVMLGINGSPKVDKVYDQLRADLFRSSNLCYFKHLCGEYKTATSFGLWLAAKMLHHQYIPEFTKIQPFEKKKLEHILIYNNYSNNNHSLLLLKHV